jgi:NADPH:quinone reductase
MHAIEVSATGGPEVLAYVERPVPEPAPGQLLIKTEAIGVNFVDTYFRTGLYPHALPFILGSEVAGTVAAVGEGVHTAHVGDHVATSDADGTYAEYCLAPADLVCHVPDGVSAEVAASAILKGQTATC